MKILSSFKIAFFGHRDFLAHRRMEERLFSLLKDAIRRHGFVEIYVGRNGEFDIFAASVAKRAQRAMGKECCELICVLPYPIKDIEWYEGYYDRVTIPEGIEKCHPKGAITKRNRWMVEEADLLIVYADREEGGTAYTLKHAQAMGKPAINLATAEEDR